MPYATGASLRLGSGIPTTNGSPRAVRTARTGRARRRTPWRGTGAIPQRRRRAGPVPSPRRTGWRSRTLLEAVELRRVAMRDALCDVRLELAEDPASPQKEPIEHRRLEEPRRPDVHADQEAVGHFLDQRLPTWIDGAGLRGKRRRPLEVHAGEIHEEIGIAHQEPVETAGRTFAAVGEDDRGLPVSGEGAIEGGLRRIGQLVVDDDRHAERRRHVEDLAEGGAGRVAVDRTATDLTYVDLSDHLGPTSVQLDRELARGALGRRVGQGQAGDH